VRPAGLRCIPSFIWATGTGEAIAQLAVRSEYFKTNGEQTRQRVGPEWINKDSDWFCAEQKDSSEDC
jgi:hypothetical protein